MAISTSKKYIVRVGSQRFQSMTEEENWINEQFRQGLALVAVRFTNFGLTRYIFENLNYVAPTP